MQHLRLFADNQPIELQRLQFPGGESHVRILGDAQPKSWTIRMDYRDDRDLIATALLCNAVRAQSSAPITLITPYMPYARQDRVATKGDSNAIQVMGTILGTLPIDEHIVWDMHSEAGLEYLGPLARSIPAADFIRPLLNGTECLVAPDHGAIERTTACKVTPTQQIIYATKERDPVTGYLKNPNIVGDIPTNTELIVIDDICDGGRTFLQLGEVLRQHTTAPLKLYVTHGIFSQGLNALHNIYDEILTPNPFNPELIPQLTIVPEPRP